MTTETRTTTSILSEDERNIIGLLQYVENDAEEFDDPENGDFVDRLEALFRNSKGPLDANVVRIAVDRTRFFLNDITESYFSGTSVSVYPETSELSERLDAALSSTDVQASTGIKGELLEHVTQLHSHFVFGDPTETDSASVKAIAELVAAHSIEETELFEFISFNILDPWDEYVEEDDVDDRCEDYPEWEKQTAAMRKLFW
jgi:hypothetical protein